MATDATVDRVSAGGIDSPLRRSRTRLPATIVSTVTTSVEYPLSAARETRSSACARFLVRYS